MLAHVVVFWAVRLCRPVSGYKGFGGIFEVRGLSRTPTRVCVFFFFLKKLYSNKQTGLRGNASGLFLRGSCFGSWLG